MSVCACLCVVAVVDGLCCCCIACVRVFVGDCVCLSVFFCVYVFVSVCLAVWFDSVWLRSAAVVLVCLCLFVGVWVCLCLVVVRLVWDVGGLFVLMFVGWFLSFCCGWRCFVVVALFVCVRVCELLFACARLFARLCFVHDWGLHRVCSV